MHRRTWFAFGLAVLLAAGSFVAGSRAVRAEDEEAGGAGMPPPQKKVDSPFLKSLLGSWTWTATGMLEGSGTVTWKLALGDTAVIEDIEGSAKAQGHDMQFFGHGVWKVGEDGKAVTLWWFDNMTSKAEVNEGTLSADGYEVKDPEGNVMTMKKTASGLELKMHEGAVTITFQKK